MEIKGKIIKTLSQAHRGLLNKEFSCVDLLESTQKNIVKHKDLNGFVSMKE
jgi:hypothetical protein